MDLFNHEPIRALSWWQPFGTAMLYSKVETRKWHTSYRGLVLICTTVTPFAKQPKSKRDGIILQGHHEDTLMEMMELETIAQEVPTAGLDGYAIAIGRLTQERGLKADDKTYFDHSTNMLLYAHIYTDVRRIKPFPYKGSQKWGTVDSETRKKIILL